MPESRSVDARIERWREHRAKVREEFVDAAFRALNSVGPEASMEDIAREAGAAKPKLYRFFDDKVDLYDAIADRLVELMWTRMLDSVNLFDDPARDVVEKAVAEYVHVVSEFPNVLRFIVSSYFVPADERTDRIAQSGREASRRLRQILTDQAATVAFDERVVELAILSMFAGAGAATEWWLGDNANGPEPMSALRFVEYLTVIVLGMVESVAQLNHITLTLDSPVHEAFSAVDQLP